MTVDEYETIRLVDKEGLSQEDCGTQLGVGRTTVQKIYETARRKIADALVLGRSLRIEGCDFYLCNENSEFCYQKSCLKRQFQAEYKMDKGEDVMRIAVTYENGDIYQHFGHTERFKIYDVQDGKVMDSCIIDTNGQWHGALAECGIELFGGVSGNADAAVDAYLADNLSYDPM